MSGLFSWPFKKKPVEEQPLQLNTYGYRERPIGPELKVTMNDLKDLYEEARALNINDSSEINTIDAVIKKYIRSYLIGNGYKLSGLYLGVAYFLKASALRPTQFEMFSTDKDVVKKLIVQARDYFNDGIIQLKHFINSIYKDTNPNVDDIKYAYNNLIFYCDKGLEWEYTLDRTSRIQNSILRDLFNKDKTEFVPFFEVLEYDTFVSLVIVDTVIKDLIIYFESELSERPGDKNILSSIAKCYMLLFKKSKNYDHLERSKMYLNMFLEDLKVERNDDITTLIEEVIRSLDEKDKRLGPSCAGGGASASGGALMPPLPFDGGSKSRTRRNKTRSRKNKSRARRNKSRKIKKRIRTKK
jgi:hypothetical protein